MTIPSITSVNNNPSFKANPVSNRVKRWDNIYNEDKQALLNSVGISGIVGCGAGLLSACLKKGGKSSLITGVKAGLAALCLTSVPILSIARLKKAECVYMGRSKGTGRAEHIASELNKASVSAGIGAGLITSCFTKGMKLPLIAGSITALAALYFRYPLSIGNTISKIFDKKTDVGQAKLYSLEELQSLQDKNTATVFL